MKRKLKMIAAGLAALMAVSGLAACGGKDDAKTTTQVTDNFNKEGYPIVKDKITMKMMGVINPAYVKWEENEFFKRMEEKTNIHFEFTTVTQDAWAEKKSLAFASGDLPDIFLKAALSAKEEAMYGEDGSLIALESLIEQYAPNLTKIFEERPTVKRNITTLDKHIYALPYINSGKSSANFFINKKWMDELGFSEPETPEELYQILKAFKQRDPNCIPFSVTGTDQLSRFLAAFGILFNEDNIFLEGDKVTFSPIDERYKRGLKYLHKLYQEQLLDSEVFTQTKQQHVAKGSSGRLGMYYAASPMNVVDTKYHFDYLSMLPMSEEKGGKKIARGSSETLRGAFAITKKNQYPAESIRWVDELYSEEGGIMATAGVKDVDYKFNEDGSWDYILQDGEKTSNDRLAKISVQGVVYFPLLYPEEFMAKINNPYEKFLQPQNERIYPYQQEMFPQTYFPLESQTRIASLTADINAYVTQSMAQFVTGDLNIDNDWDNYMNTLKRMGVDDLIKIYQDRYDNYLAGN